MNEAATRGAIVKALDGCLLTDAEMEVYETARGGVRCDCFAVVYLYIAWTAWRRKIVVFV